jgi:hypothetical protein
MTRLVTALLFATAVVFGQVGAPPPSQSVPAAATGFVSGRVIDAVSGKPIPEVTILLLSRPSAPVAGGAAAGAGGRGAPPPPPQPTGVITDSQGRFFFGGLPPGVVQVAVSKIGYLSNPPAPLELGEGEKILDLTIRLPKQSSLAGVVRDDAGDPVVGIDVNIFRRGVTSGRQSWVLVNRVKTDDRGGYLLSRLEAGDFVVCACGRDPIPFDNLLLTTLGSEPLQLLTVAARALSVGADAVSLDTTLRAYAPTFYPNSASVARAMKIAVAAGEDKAGIDINVPLVRATRVSGQILGAPGPMQAFALRLIPESDAEFGQQIFSIPPMLVQPDGRFDFTTVPPGQYRLIVVYRSVPGANAPSGAAMVFAGARGVALPPAGATMSNAGPSSADPPLWASEPVTVGENGVSGWAVTLNRSLPITGRVQWIGGAPQPAATMIQRATISMQPTNFSDPMAGMMGAPIGRLSPDAAFVVPGAVPGKYTFNMQVLPGFPTLKSVMIGGADLTDLPIVVADKEVADLVVTYVDTPMASLTITLAGAPAVSGDDGSLLVFPSDRKYWTEPSAARRRFRQIANTPKNSVTTPELPAGDYLVAMASALDAVDWMEAGKLELLSRRAQRVTVGDSGKATIEVRR